MNYYKFNGLTIGSEIPIPFLTNSTNHIEDVTFTFGSVKVNLDNPIKQTQTYEISQENVLIKLPRIGRFHIRQGAYVTIEPDKQCSPMDLCTFLLGVVWAALSYQRGRNLLKGTLLSINNENWLISGLTTVGTSTFALGMHEYCNAQILSDDFCSFQSNGEDILVCAGIPALKLWQKSLSHFNLDCEPHIKVRSGLNKYWIPLTSLVDEKKILHGIMTLREWRSDEKSQVGIEKLTGFKGLKKAYQNNHHSAYKNTKHDSKQRFQQDLQLVQQSEMASYTFKHGFEYLEESCHHLHKWLLK